MIVRNNKRVSILLAVVCTLLPSWLVAGFAGEKIVIGTGSMTGLYYPIGASLCKFLAQDYHEGEKIICSVSSTTGGFYNLNSMRNCDMDIGIAQSDWEYDAYGSFGPFRKLPPMHDMRLIASMHKEYFSILARKDANVKTIDDLKGKRVNIGAPGTGVRGAMLKLMKMKGWDENDFSVVSELKSSEQAQALCDDKIDVMSDFVGHPNASMQEATVACDAVFVPLDEKIIAQLNEKYTYYEPGIIKGNLYRDNPNDTPTISVHSSLLTTTNLSDDIAYKLSKSIVTHFDELRTMSGALSNITKEGLVNQKSAAPLHNGARRYYEEIGLLQKNSP